MVGVIFTDVSDRTVPGSYFVPMSNVLLRMPRFEDCAEFSPFMEGIYLPEGLLRGRLTRRRESAL